MLFRFKSGIFNCHDGYHLLVERSVRQSLKLESQNTMRSGAVVQTRNASYLQTVQEAHSSQGEEGQPGQHNKTLSQKRSGRKAKFMLFSMQKAPPRHMHYAVKVPPPSAGLEVGVGQNGKNNCKMYSSSMRWLACQAGVRNTQRVVEQNEVQIFLKVSRIRSS